MKSFLAIGFVAIISGVVFASAVESQDKSHGNPASEKMIDKVDVNLDEQSAIQIAEAVLVRVYRKKVLEERPWHVAKNGEAFRIAGTLKQSGGAAMTKGGVATIEINQMNAEVMSITHGK